MFQIAGLVKVSTKRSKLVEEWGLLMKNQAAEEVILGAFCSGVFRRIHLPSRFSQFWLTLTLLS
jgi:hypothetical protein